MRTRIKELRKERSTVEDAGSLDQAQSAAVLAPETNVLVQAAVGSGKTTVLVHRLLHLHLGLGVPLEDIAVLTFTLKAAAEIRHRLEALVGRDQARGAWRLGTFHSVALALLGRGLPVEKVGFRRDFGVLDDEDREALVRELISSHDLRLKRRRGAAERLREPPELHETDDLPRLRQLFAKAKRDANAMDFDDLLDNATRLSTPRDAPRWVLVDELQDCSPRELAFIRALCPPETGFFGVGDPLQSIYGWRGSHPAVFATLASERAARVYRLPTNYRSTSRILEAGRSALGVQTGGEGPVQAVRDAGEPVVIRRHHDGLSEALYVAEQVRRLLQEGVPPREVAVLFRLNAQAERLRDALAGLNVAFVEGPDAESDAVSLLTLHGAKGLEFRHVFIVGVNEGVLPLGREKDVAEERRLLFVGITRAKDRLEISYVARPYGPGAVGEPSPLLLALPAQVTEWAERAPPRSSSPPPEHRNTWAEGQAVVHPRYGNGVVVSIESSQVRCLFGKLGERTFPLKLCPLHPAAHPHTA